MNGCVLSLSVLFKINCCYKSRKVNVWKGYKSIAWRCRPDTKLCVVLSDAYNKYHPVNRLCNNMTWVMGRFLSWVIPFLADSHMSYSYHCYW